MWQERDFSLVSPTLSKYSSCLDQGSFYSETHPYQITRSDQGRKYAQPLCNLESGEASGGTTATTMFPSPTPSSSLGFPLPVDSFLLDPLLISLTQGCSQVSPAVPNLPGWLYIDNPNPNCWKRISWYYSGPLSTPGPVSCDQGGRDTVLFKTKGRTMGRRKGSD